MRNFFIPVKVQFIQQQLLQQLQSQMSIPLPHQGDVLESEQGLSALRLDTALATTSLERAGASGRTSTAERVTSSWLEHSVVVAELQLKTQQKAKNLHERFQSRFAM